MTKKCRPEKYLRLIVASLWAFFDDPQAHVFVIHFSVIAFG
jgi:hypothetical protein